MKEIRFRNEKYSGSMVRDAASVIAYEMYKSGNIDIPDILGKTIFKNTAVAKAYTNELIKEIESNNATSSASCNWEVSLERANALLQLVKAHTDKDIKYALWLADIEPVMYGIYAKELQAGEYVDAYKVGSVVLSDMGENGTLYGYVEEPVAFSHLTKISKKEGEN